MLNRVAGYSGFDNMAVTGISSLKPGQTKLDRDYYKDANRTKADGRSYLSTYSRFKSVHQDTVDSAVKPSDYHKKNTGNQNMKYEYLHNPDLFKHTKAGRDEFYRNTYGVPRASTELKRVASENITKTEGQTNNNLYKTTKHWTSNYQNDSNKAVSRPHSQAQRPFWSYPKREHVARRTFFKTEYENTLGGYGHNPRKILNHESTKLESEVNELTMGSTKVTSHIPGYGGFLVKTDLNEKALLHTKNNNPRNLMKNKVNMNENFNVKMPGYSGHKPLSCLNDRGSVRPQLFSTQGEKFF